MSESNNSAGPLPYWAERDLGNEEKAAYRTVIADLLVFSLFLYNKLMPEVIKHDLYVTREADQEKALEQLEKMGELRGPEVADRALIWSQWFRQHGLELVESEELWRTVVASMDCLALTLLALERPAGGERQVRIDVFPLYTSPRNLEVLVLGYDRVAEWVAQNASPETLELL